MYSKQLMSINYDLSLHSDKETQENKRKINSEHIITFCNLDNGK